MLNELATKLSAAVKPLDNLAGAGEAVLLALITRLASWAASIPNMLMVSRAAMVMFDVTFGLGLTIAASLELIGHSLTSLWLDTKEHNATKRVSDPSANERLALVLVVCFFAIDVSMVAALCWHQYITTGTALIWLALFYPVIGIATAIATNTRAHLWRARQAILAEREAKAAERQAKRATGSETQSATSEQPAESSEAVAESSELVFAPSGMSEQHPLVLPFACEVCQQAFASQPALNAHKRKHSGGNGHKSEMIAERSELANVQ
jgi:hypothetical protein